jgi:uncharacterized membrane protein YfcA
MGYIETLNSFNLSLTEWLLLGFTMVLLGMGKAGIKGLSVIIVIILALLFGEKPSTGVLISMLVFADILAVFYYRRHVKWEYVFKLLPWMVVGVLIGVLVGNDISAVVFKRIMAVIIVVTVLIMLFFEKKKNLVVSSNKVFSSSMGFLAGFTTMIGNLAGPIANIYFLAIRFPKNEFIGTGAMLFFIVNVFKVPFHIFVWNTVTLKTLVLNSVLFPIILVGFCIGINIVKKISNTNYRKFVLAVTAIGGVIMLLRA